MRGRGGSRGGSGPPQQHRSRRGLDTRPARRPARRPGAHPRRRRAGRGAGRRRHPRRACHPASAAPRRRRRRWAPAPAPRPPGNDWQGGQGGVRMPWGAGCARGLASHAPPPPPPPPHLLARLAPAAHHVANLLEHQPREQQACAGGGVAAQTEEEGGEGPHGSGRGTPSAGRLQTRGHGRAPAAEARQCAAVRGAADRLAGAHLPRRRRRTA